MIKGGSFVFEEIWLVWYGFVEGLMERSTCRTGAPPSMNNELDMKGDNT